MKKSYLLFTTLMLAVVMTNAQTPFTGCPNVNLAITRGGNNTYNFDPVSMYDVNPVDGSNTLIAGGPIKTQDGSKNLDINAVGLNTADNLLYGINPSNNSAPDFYRIGHDYVTMQIGKINPPAPQSPNNSSVINGAAGTIDLTGKYYFTAVAGVGNFFAQTFTPDVFYVGTISNVAGLISGSTAFISPTYLALNFTNADCSEYYTTLKVTTSAATAQNTGLRGLCYNTLTGLLYSYVTFETSSGSNIFKGQLININPSTGLVSCFPSSTLTGTSTDASGILMTTDGNMQVLFTDGSLWSASTTSPGGYTGSITQLPNTLPVGRGDLASCGQASTLPVTFESFTGVESNCSVNFKWQVSQEINVAKYELELMDNYGSYKTFAQVKATNSEVSHGYNVVTPISAKKMKARVKQTDVDGRFSYSAIISVNTTCAGNKSIAIINSVAIHNKLSVRWNNFDRNESVTIAIYNGIGAQQFNQKIAINSNFDVTEIDVNNFANGTYFVKAISASGNKYNAVFIKK